MTHFKENIDKGIKKDYNRDKRIKKNKPVREHGHAQERTVIQMNCTTESIESQVSKIFQKLAIKKYQNEKIIDYLYSTGQHRKALTIENCATNIGISSIDGKAKIVKADFCRERLCMVCAWRRQARFIAQMSPVMELMEQRGYQFLFATLTIENCLQEDIQKTIDVLVNGFANLRKRRKIKRVWKGIARSIEISYNEIADTFHPHIHMLIAVQDSYFTKQNYITQKELQEVWKDCCWLEYDPIVDIRKVTDISGSVVETLKYSLKPTTQTEAIKAFEKLKGRRLISFTGEFAKTRTELKLSDFETILTDDVEKTKPKYFDLYKFDVTGGVYSFYNRYEFERKIE